MILGGCLPVIKHGNGKSLTNESFNWENDLQMKDFPYLITGG
jgi:hypothetical protein